KLPGSGGVAFTFGLEGLNAREDPIVMKGAETPLSQIVDLQRTVRALQQRGRLNELTRSLARTPYQTYFLTHPVVDDDLLKKSVEDGNPSVSQNLGREHPRQGGRSSLSRYADYRLWQRQR